MKTQIEIKAPEKDELKRVRGILKAGQEIAAQMIALYEVLEEYEEKQEQHRDIYGATDPMIALHAIQTRRELLRLNRSYQLTRKKLAL